MQLIEGGPIDDAHLLALAAGLVERGAEESSKDGEGSLALPTLLVVEIHAGASPASTIVLARTMERGPANGQLRRSHAGPLRPAGHSHTERLRSSARVGRVPFCMTACESAVLCGGDCATSTHRPAPEHGG